MTDDLYKIHNPSGELFTLRDPGPGKLRFGDLAEIDFATGEVRVLKGTPGDAADLFWREFGERLLAQYGAGAAETAQWRSRAERMAAGIVRHELARHEFAATARIVLGAPDERHPENILLREAEAILREKSERERAILTEASGDPPSPSPTGTGDEP